MKKSLSLILAIALVFTMAASAFAAEPTTTSDTSATTTSATYTTQEKYDQLVAAGIFEGDEDGLPHLDAKMTRAQFAKILAKVFGLSEDAAAASKAYGDLDGASWAAGFIGAVTKAGLMEGDAGKFMPSADVTTEQLATVLVRAFDLKPVAGAKVPGAADWAAGYVQAALDAKLIPAAADYTKAALRGALVEAGYAAYLEATKPTPTPTTTPTPTPAAQGLDVKTAVALNSKVVEVVLNTAPAAADVNATNVTVKDAAGAAVAVSSVVVAPYVTDSKTLLVTLGADTAIGTLYTLTSGTKSANFGGRAVDTTKPSISGTVTSSAYNEITIKFNEAIQLTDAVITVTEKYAASSTLAVSNIRYSGKDTIVATTDAQKVTLYGISVSNVTDFAGNKMDASTDKTFVGTAMPTDALKLTGATSNWANEVLVQFNLPVDPSSLKPENFKIQEMYGTNTVAVTAVRVATKDDYGLVFGTKIGDTNYAYKSYAVLTVGDLTSPTLYKVTGSALKTLYGKDLSGTASEQTPTFVGKAKPAADSLTFSNPTNNSNTSISIVFTNKLDKATAENVANYAIIEAYGTATLTVSKAELQSDNVTVNLTVSSMKNALYKTTITNVKDIYGNTINTASSANVKTFVGAAIADKISSITAATIDPTENTKLTVTFNQKVGASVADVSHYSIDGGIGYPLSAVKGNADQVVLTIPKTTDGQVYKLTVKGLENSDGVAMDAAGITGTFTGKGNVAGLPEIQAVQAIDAQTLKVFFDRAVSDSTIDGKIYNSGSGALVANALKVSKDGGSTYVALDDVAYVSAYAYKDTTLSNVLVVRVGLASAFKSATVTSGDKQFKLQGLVGLVKSSDSLNVKPFAYSDSAVTAITVDNILSLNNQTIRIYFNQAVSIPDAANFAKVAATSSETYA
ncbi:MAG: S-layer homology domain-containing protein, partial [Cohnella sp.]|nr:S-layer homology domain-containing protein [Cohnella sp.]